MAVQGAYPADLRFQIQLSAAEIQLLLRGLKKLPYEEVHQMVGDLEQTLLLPLLDKQKQAKEAQKSEQPKEALPSPETVPVEDAKPKSP